MQDPIMASIRQSSDYVVREDGISLRIGEARSISHSWLSLAQCGECSLIRNPEAVVRETSSWSRRNLPKSGAF